MGFCLTCLAKYSAVPRGLGKTSQVAVEWGDCFIPRTADLEDKITTGARTRLKCKEAQFKLSWLKAIRGAAHGGRLQWRNWRSTRRLRMKSMWSVGEQKDVATWSDAHISVVVLVWGVVPCPEFAILGHLLPFAGFTTLPSHFVMKALIDNSRALFLFGLTLRSTDAFPILTLKWLKSE